MLDDGGFRQCSAFQHVAEYMPGMVQPLPPWTEVLLTGQVAETFPVNTVAP
jgi:hypothetical protein